MHTKALISFVLFAFLFLLPAGAFAQQPPQQEILKAEVTKIVTEGEIIPPYGKTQQYQTVQITLLDGNDKGKTITIDHGKMTTLREQEKVTLGEKIVVAKMSTPGGTQYQIVDKYRLDTLLPILFIFFALILAMSRLKGLGAILGLFISLGVILLFIVPQILAGHDPVVISIIGACIIMATTIYLAHGFSRKTHIALASTAISLVLTGLLAALFVNITKLTGLGSEDAFSLLIGPAETINFRGLLLGGIIIGALGVLDDITTSLSATVEEIKKANPSYTFMQLARSGLRVGSEHISSLVNTLVLAYAGAGLPLFLFLVLNPQHFPVWAILNSELMMEEIVRTITGSFGLVLAVPLTTLLSAWIVSRKKK